MISFDWLVCSNSYSVNKTQFRRVETLYRLTLVRNEDLIKMKHSSYYGIVTVGVIMVIIALVAMLDEKTIS